MRARQRKRYFTISFSIKRPKNTDTLCVPTYMSQFLFTKEEIQNMKSVLITGAGGGMGKAAVKLFEQSGYRVFAADILPCEGRDNVIPLQMDVRDENSVKEAFKKASETVDELYAVIHLAGIYALDSLVEMPTKEFEKIIDVNLKGAFLVNKTFLPLFKEDSRIIIVTSELAVRDPLPFTGIYGISKSALDHYAYSLRMELQLLGMSVSVLRAGAVDTGMISESTKQLDEFCRKTEIYKCNAKRFHGIVDRIESRRVAPEKIARKLLLIAGQKKPRFAYSVNRNPLLILFDLLPMRLRFFIIRRIL